MGGKDGDDKPVGFKLGFTGAQEHPMRLVEAQRKITDKFGDGAGLDTDRYRRSAAGDSGKAQTELKKIHAMVAQKRPPKPVLFKLYAKLIAEAAGRAPFEKDQLPRLRRELALAEPTEDGLAALLAKYGARLDP